MWYYVIHGNDSQLLHRSKAEYVTKEEALAAGKERMPDLAPLGVILSLQAGQQRLEGGNWKLPKGPRSCLGSS